MEILCAVARIVTAKGGMRYDYAWIKKEGEALTKTQLKLLNGELLSAVWTCDWKVIPSKYKCIKGASSEDIKGPNFDMGAELRSKFLKAKGVKQQKKEAARLRNAIQKELDERKQAEQEKLWKPAWHPHIPVVAVPKKEA